MKIYCGRQRNETDQEIFDRILGTDLWVRVKFPDNGPYCSLFVNVVDKQVGQPQYTVYKFYVTNRNDLPVEIPEDLMDTAFGRRTYDIDELIVVRPIEMFSSDELFTVVDAIGDD